MNIILYSPGLFVLLLQRFGFVPTVQHIVLCGLVQLLVGLPFLTGSVVGYFQGAFNLGRVFIYYWSVNWKFIPEEIFLSKPWGIFLLICTLLVWFIFAHKIWEPMYVTKYLS